MKARIEELAAKTTSQISGLLGDDTESIVRAALTALAEECIEEAAQRVSPGRGQPCDCIVKNIDGTYYMQDCFCANSGDIRSAESWCEGTNNAAKIRAMKGGLK